MSRATTQPDAGTPTPERRRRSAFVEGPAVATDDAPAVAGARVYRSVSVLQRLARSGTIEPRQLIAGERLRDDYELGVAGAREPAAGSSATTGWYYPDARLAALRRYQYATAALGPTSTIVNHVAVFDTSVNSLARTLNRNRQELSGILKLGLEVLADHYKLDM